MANLAKDIVRIYEGGGDPAWNDLPVAAATQLYQGAAIGMASGAGVAKNLAGTDVAFCGFAERGADNSGGAASAIDVHVRSSGIVKLAVTGVTATTAPGTPVYASDGDTFTTTALNNVAIGRVHRVLGAGSAMIAFESSSLRSIDTSEV